MPYTPEFFEDAHGIGPLGTYPFNKIYFLKPESAAQLAALFAGWNPVLSQANAIITGGPFAQSRPNQMITFTDAWSRTTGPVIAGVFAAAYFDHGFPEPYAIQMATADIISRMVTPA